MFFSSLDASAKTAKKKASWGKWFTTHGLDKFPCMNDKEVEYFQRWIHIAHNEERKQIMTEHRKQVTPSARMPAAVRANSIISKRFVCPPFRGVRDPHPQVIDFGKAATFEHIRITENEMQILQGLKRNEKWPLHFSNEKGYFEGKTSGGTPINIIPMTPPPGENIRFIVQYLIWQDKTPPIMTICYREDLHHQCNPYQEPVEKPLTPASPERLPASEPKKQKSKG